ncbi:MAG: ABC transporter ATP-binding protein [Gammaproteobacteria bacterium]|nr:ABC transporter ATP-binding protein [Gammaproteobacteria bacterium]
MRSSIRSEAIASSSLNDDECDPPSVFTWRYIFTVALRSKRELVQAHVIAIFAVIVSVPIPLLMPLLVDEVLLNQPGKVVEISTVLFPQSWQGPTLLVAAVLLVTLVLRFLMLALGVWQLRKFALIAKQVTYKIRQALLLRLQYVSMSAFETMGSGSIASHLITDVNAIDSFIGESISKAIVAVLSIVGIAGVLLWMHWQLALFILLMNPVVISFTVLLAKRVKHLKKNENVAVEVFQHALTETLDAIQQIRASNRENYYIKDVAAKAAAIKVHSARYAWKSDAANRFSFGVFLFGFDTFRAITMLMVVFSDLTVGQMIAVFGYLWFMMAPVQEILNMQYVLYAAKAALVRINALMVLPQEPRYPHIKNPFKGKQTVSVVVEDVSFTYNLVSDSLDKPDVNDNVLNHVNLKIAAGEKIALVGASGGGKSTLVQVMLGLYPPQAGQLYFDGVPVTEIGLDVVRENVATVLQHPALFNDTVRMNLTLGQDISDQNLYDALSVAQLADSVKAMPQQLSTVIGRQGVRLSGGQRQRLAIARMVLLDPKVVILDEATSALDTETEEKVHHALNEFLKDRTTIIIAHRLSAVKQADRVYVFENGHIIEEGGHDELIKNGGLYHRLYGRRQQI